MLDENTKIKMENPTKGTVGFTCITNPTHYNFAGGQVIGVKWEHLQDAMYGPGLRVLFEEGLLRICPDDPNYEEVMDNLQLNNLKEVVEKTLSATEVKKLLSMKPLSMSYIKIKDALENGSKATKENIATVALEMKIKDYTINEAIKKATDVDVIKNLQLAEEPETKEKAEK